MGAKQSNPINDCLHGMDDCDTVMMENDIPMDPATCKAVQDARDAFGKMTYRERAAVVLPFIVKQYRQHCHEDVDNTLSTITDLGGDCTILLRIMTEK